MADQPTLKVMADKGVWLSLQPFQAGDNPLTPEQMKKAEPTSHWDRVAAWAKTAGTRVAFGTDLLFQPDGTKNQPVLLTRFAKIFGNATANGIPAQALELRSQRYQRQSLTGPGIAPAPHGSPR